MKKKYMHVSQNIAVYHKLTHHKSTIIQLKNSWVNIERPLDPIPRLEFTF